jgi:DNA-binding transcriptional LysR family regulator
MDRFLKRGIKISHLRLADALMREGQLSSAACAIGISQPAASRLASEVERIIGAPLYIRAGRGIELTPEGLALAHRARRVLHEISDADREITELKSGLTGKVSIGAVTGPAIEHVLPALRQARITLPNVQIDVEVGTSDTLGPMLQSGQLDFALARLPKGADPATFHMTMVSKEPLSIVARHGHPVLQRKDHSPNSAVPVAELLKYDWVMPNEGAILHNTVRQALTRRGLPLPERVLRTSSFLLVLATISQTNAVAPVATSVAHTFTSYQDDDMSTSDIPRLVHIIKTDIDFEVEDYGLITRAGVSLPPVAQSVMRLLCDGIGIATPTSA